MPDPDRGAFVRRLYPVARKYAALTGIPADVFIAMAAHESNFGNAGSTFGIKGPGQTYATHEYVNGQRVDVNDSFRTYPSDDAAFEDFVGLVSTGRYAPAWARLRATGDWRGFLRGINDAGYATDPNWAGKIARFASDTIAPMVSAFAPRTAEAAEMDSTGGSGVDTQGDRPSSEFEAPSRYASAPPAAGSRSSRMAARITELQRQRAEAQARIEVLLKPGPDELPAQEGDRLNPLFQAQAEQARRNRELELAHWRAQLSQADTALRAVETDLANDPDAKPIDPVAAEKSRVELQAAQLALSQAQNKAAVAASPEARRLAELEVRKAELGVQQAELALERTRNPLPPQRAPRYPEEVAQAQQNLTKGALDIQKAQQDLLPRQQQILQGHLETVTYVQGMLERGEIDQPTADAWIATSKAASEAALRGATPFQEMKDRRDAEQARQRMGTDLLTQRLSSGAGLASSLLSAASGLAGHAMLRPGQTSLGVDPLAQLMPLLAELQGGQDVTPFARGLLMGGQQGPPPAASGMPGALPAGL